MAPHTSITVRTPDDLLACVPLLLGFLPERSAVVVSLPPGRGPHARADVLHDTDLGELGRGLLDPMLRHEVTRVALVVYADLPHAQLVGLHLAERFDAAGVEVVAAVAADGAHWLSVVPETTVPREYDALSHPFVAEAVVAGQVVLGSRQAVRDQLRLDADLSARTDETLRDDTTSVDAEWVRATLGRHLAAGTLPDAREVALLRRGIEDQDGRDAAWAWAERHDARSHVELWLRVVRSCTAQERSEPAAVLAFHAWLAGDGALAWCAVEASQAGERSCSLTRLVEDLLTRAAPPTMWQPLMEGPEGVSERARTARADRSDGAA